MLGKVIVFAAAATSGIQGANINATALSLVCLLIAPAWLLMSHRGIDLLLLVLAALGWISFLASCFVNHVSVLWPNAVAPAAFGLYFIGLTVLTGRKIDSIALVLAGLAAGTVVFFAMEGIELTHTGRFADVWKYGIASAVTVLVLFALTIGRVPTLVVPAVLAVLGLASLGLNYRAHALVCFVAAGTLLINRLFGARLRRGWQFAGLIMIGLAFAYVMPLVARTGVFGSALQHKTVEQETFNVPLLLAGRTEPPMSITAILERPLLGWGSAMNLTPDVYTRAQHLATRLGFSPTFPFDVYWELPPSNYSAMHSILLGSWAEGGVLAVLLPAALLVVCLGIVWNFSRLGRWAPLGLTVALQGIWDIIYGPWLYNMIPTFVCLALLFGATHFRGPQAQPPLGR
jgi:O-antigen ligase